MIEDTVQGGGLTKIDAPIETFGSAMAVLDSTRIPTSVSKLAIIDFQCITTPSFVRLYMFALIIPYFYCLLRKNYYCLSKELDAMIPYMPIRLYKRHDAIFETIPLVLLRRLKKLA